MPTLYKNTYICKTKPLYMHTKLIKILALTYLFINICPAVFPQVSLQGNPQTVDMGDGNGLYEHYRTIATHIITAAIFIQTGALVYNIAKNSPKSKKAAMQYLGGIAVLSIILSIL